jgi:hypothetical protein
MAIFDPAGVALHIIARLAFAGLQAAQIDGFGVMLWLSICTALGALAGALRRRWPDAEEQ